MSWVDPVEPIVKMDPTAFRSYTIRLVGTQATRIAPAAPWPQRLVIRHGAEAQFVFLSDSTAELESVGGVFPIGAYHLRAATPTVLVIAPDQSLYAVASVDLNELSISRSQAIPKAHDPGPLRPSTFRGHNLQIPVGTPNAAKQIVTPSTRPQRVVIREVEQSDVFLSASPATLNQATPGATIPGAYRIAAGDPTQIFVTAAGQALYAAPAVVQTLFVSVSEISPVAPEGPTGIPGPDGQE
jgi:hypothetical protein